MLNSLQYVKHEMLHNKYIYILFLAGQFIFHMKIYSMYNVDYSLYPQFSFHCGLGLFTRSPTGKYNYTKNIGNTSNSNDLCSMRWADQVGLVSPNDNKHMEIFLWPPETMNDTNMSSMIQDRYPKQLCEVVCSIIPRRFIKMDILDQCARNWL